MTRRSPRTLLELLVQDGDYTLDEWCDRFAALADELGEDATLSTRQLQRWASGQITDARPAARRLAARLWGYPFATLVASPPVRLAVGTGTQAGWLLDRRRLLEVTGAALLGRSRLVPLGAPERRSPTRDVDALDEAAELWHELVRTDNLLGPRHALAGALGQLDTLQALLTTARSQARTRTVQLASWYGEMVAWLYEDAGDLPTALSWTSRAMEWALEARDDHMVAWTLYRRSQQAVGAGDFGQAVGLAVAARRNDDRLPSPMRAAIRVQEAHARAADGDKVAPWPLLDEAHEWAATDATGDARFGHGSFCTSEFIELQRASCLLAIGDAQRSVDLFERVLPALDPVYVKNRGAAQSRLAAAHGARGEPAGAAVVANEALDIVLACGSGRVLVELTALGASLRDHASLPEVAILLERLPLTVGA